MDCIIAAGGVPKDDDPLYAYTQGKPKALLDINGRSMLERVVDALQEAHSIEDIVVIGLGDDVGLTFRRPVHHLPNQGSLIGNVLAGIHWVMERKPETTAVMIGSADIPALTGPMVEHFIEACQPLDKSIYYSFVTKEIMETRYPHSSRTYTRLKGLEIAGGDIVIMQARLADEHQELWPSFINARKHAWRLARLLGWRTLLKLLLRQLTIADIEALAGRLLGTPGKIIFTPYAELAMDADKPNQYELLVADMAAKG